MGTPKVVIGRLIEDQLLVKSIAISKTVDWLKWLDADELVEFLSELLRLVTQISQGKKGAEALSLFLSEWRETALLNREPEVLADMMTAEKELDAGGGKDWSLLKTEIGI